jgi:hypothetical protein
MRSSYQCCYVWNVRFGQKTISVDSNRYVVNGEYVGTKKFEQRSSEGCTETKEEFMCQIIEKQKAVATTCDSV